MQRVNCIECSYHIPTTSKGNGIKKLTWKIGWQVIRKFGLIKGIKFLLRKSHYVASWCNKKQTFIRHRKLDRGIHCKAFDDLAYYR